MSIARPRVAAAALAAATVLASSVTAVSVLLPSPASAAVTGSVESGTATWGLSTYLNSANFGRPNPLPEGYLAPAAFDATTRLSTFGAGTGVVAPDGGADLAFAGTSVNFAKTSGAWLKLTAPEVELDASGNGTVSAVVSYGQSVTGTAPAMTYDATQPPARGPLRVDLVDLAGNTAADAAIAPDAATWTGLDGTWSPDFTAFLAGDPAASPAVPAFIYAGQVNANADRTPLPFTVSVATVTPEVTAAVTDASYGDGVTVAVAGTGFRAVTKAGDAGVYVGIAESGGLPDVSTPGGASAFAAFDWIMPPALDDGDFSVSLTAPTDKLDPTKSYSVYTWQAHTHSSTGQDTVTALPIDFAELVPQQSATTATGPTTRSYGSTSTLTAAVPGPGSVTLTGVGPAQTRDVSGGRAAFTVPAALAVGSYTATLTYSGGGDYLGSETTRTLRVTKATPRVVTTVTKKPVAGSTAKAGRAKVVVKGPDAVAAPTGRVTVKLSKAGAKARTVKATLRGGAVTVTVPKLAKGRWTVKTTYAGSPSFTSAARTTSLTVR